MLGTDAVAKAAPDGFLVLIRERQRPNVGPSMKKIGYDKLRVSRR